VRTEKLGGVAGGEGECGDDVAGWLVRERRRLDILPVKKEAKLSASEMPEVVGSGEAEREPPSGLLFRFFGANTLAVSSGFTEATEVGLIICLPDVERSSAVLTRPSRCDPLVRCAICNASAITIRARYWLP